MDSGSGLSLQHAEELNRLGTLQETYASDPASRGRNARLLWVGFTVFLLLGLLLVASPFLPRPKDVAPTPLPVLILFGLFLGFFLVACGWRLRQLARGGRVRVLVFTEGLARFDGTSLSTGRWDEIETVEGIVKTYQVNSAPVGSRFLLTVKFADGKQMRIDAARDHLGGMHALYQRICVESTRHLLPRCCTAIESGQTVPFGVLGVSKAGLHWGKHVLAWNDSENVDLKERLRIRNPNTWPLHPWVRLVDFAIPNQLVFLRLVEHYARDHGQGTVPSWAN
jgi:hypothetical protein